MAFIEYATQMSAEETLSVSARTAAGRPVPIDVEQAESTVVVSVPLAACAILLTFRVTDRTGTLTGQVTHRLDPEVVKWKSRYNYHFHQQHAYFIRDSVRNRLYLDSPRVDITYCIPDGDQVIVWGMVSTPSPADDLSKLVVLDRNFHEFSADVIAMGHYVPGPAERAAGVSTELTFSLRLPAAEDFFTLYYPGSTPQRGGLFTLASYTKEFYLHVFAEKTVNALQEPRYHDWFLKRRANRKALRRQVSEIEHWGGDRPFFSIVVPLYKTPRKLLVEMIQSVLAQSYQNFELILVNTVSCNGEIQDIIDRYQREVPNIKVVNLEDNLGITLNTKAGIDSASGDYVAFLDHDDTIEPDLLYEYAKAVRDDPSTVMLYCDEDKIGPDGRFRDPFFKPDFGVYFLRGINYVCHLLCVKRSELVAFDIADAAFDGAQDHNVALQAAETGLPVKHVAKVLYHWRITETSTAASLDNKPYATKAAELSVNNHINRIGRNARITAGDVNCKFRVDYLPEGNPLVSIIIPTKDNPKVLDACLRSILEKSTYDNYEIVVVENNSTKPETFHYYEQIQNDEPRIRVITWDGAFNFSKIVNFGAAHSEGDYLLFLNDDTEVITPTWLEEMLGICQDPQVGAVGTMLLYRDGTIQHAGIGMMGTAPKRLHCYIPVGAPTYFNLANVTREVSAVTAACMMTDKDTFESVGGFEEELAIAFNDVDYCLKVRDQGKLVIYDNWVRLYHYESLSRGRESVTMKRKERFQQELSLLSYRWPHYFAYGDPYCNQNLDQGSEHYALGPD